jgi:hypothetical protein
VEKSEDFFKANKSVENWRLEKPRKNTHTHTHVLKPFWREEKKETNWLNLASRKKNTWVAQYFFGRTFALWRQMLWEFFLGKIPIFSRKFCF